VQREVRNLMNAVAIFEQPRRSFVAQIMKMGILDPEEPHRSGEHALTDFGS